MIQSLFHFIKKFITAKQFLNTFRKSPKDFTRNRKVTFTTMILLILSSLGRSIQAGIDEFIITMNTDFDTYSKQAFSKRRQCIKPEAFLKILKLSSEFFYENADFKTFHNYKILAVDGSKIDLPYNKQLMDKYGCQKGTNNSIQALASCVTDVMNNIVVDQILAPCCANERLLAQQHIQHLNEVKTGKEIILFDRGYPSSELIDELEKNNMKYVMRCGSVFTKGLKKKLKGNDCVITHKFEKTKIELTMRIVSFPISSKNTEMIVTNIFDKEFKPDDFKILYNMRWGIEKTYNCVKNMFCLESFTGSLPDTVLQDFYAILFLYNAASVIVFENEKKLSEKYKKRSNKLKYKTNLKMTVIKVKDILIKSLLSNSGKKRDRLFAVLSRQLEREVIPIRDNRFYERKIKHTKHKFSQNQKL